MEKCHAIVKRFMLHCSKSARQCFQKLARFLDLTRKSLLCFVEIHFSCYSVLFRIMNSTETVFQYTLPVLKIYIVYVNYRFSVLEVYIGTRPMYIQASLFSCAKRRNIKLMMIETDKHIQSKLGRLIILYQILYHFN